MTLPRRRNRSAEDRAAANVRWADLPPEAVRGRVTLPLQTAVDCPQVRIGGRVLRFGYHDVMDDPEYVEAVLRDVVALGPASGPLVGTADSSRRASAA